MDLTFLFMASGMVFVAAVAQSMTGFGFALLVVPLLSLIWNPQSVVVVSTILNGLLSISITFHLRREIAPSRIGLLLTGALAGIPLGLAVLATLDPAPLRILIGAMVILLGLLIYFGIVYPLKSQRWPLLATGMLSGVLQASTSMGGPPAVLYLMSQGYGKLAVRGTLLGFFGPLSLLALLGFAMAGLVHPDVMLVSVALVPATIFGILVGDAAFRRTTSGLFRVMVVLLIVAAGILSVATGFRGLSVQ